MKKEREKRERERKNHRVIVVWLVGWFGWLYGKVGRMEMWMEMEMEMEMWM